MSFKFTSLKFLSYNNTAFRVKRNSNEDNYDFYTYKYFQRRKKSETNFGYKGVIFDK